MARVKAPLQTFNRGRISKLALARTDLERLRLSAEVQTNWMPRALGSMMLRPGLKYIGTMQNHSSGRLIPAVYNSTDTALLEITSTRIQVWMNDGLVTRSSSTSVVTNGGFDTDVTGWTDADESGATSEWFTGGYLSLVGTRFARAIRRQTVTASSGEHSLVVNIERGRVHLKVGSSAGGDDYISEKTLRPGHYHFGITSTGNFSIEFAANTYYRSLVNSVNVSTGGTMTLNSTWVGADLGNLRWDQSEDVIFVACDGYQPKRLERYSSDSWGVAQFEPQDGPFLGPNVTNKRLTPSGITGNITLACDKPLFTANHVGALFQITSVGQEVSVTPSAADQWSNPIRVSGVDDTRLFEIIITSTGYDATLRVQRSIGETGNWSNVTGLLWPSSFVNVSTDHNDDLDNQIIFYRIGVGATYSSGSPTATLRYAAGGITGIVRIDAVAASTESSASVLLDLGSTEATETWQEGAWSTHRKWPTAVAIHDGRLWWGGQGKLWSSVAGALESYDPDVEGDAGPITKAIPGGAANKVEWLVSLGRLIVGTGTRELQAKTSSLDEPLTPTNFELKDISTQGSANVAAVKVDKRLLFVQRGGVRVMELGYSGESLDYETADRTVAIPEMGEPSIVRMAVQRQPDTRVHAVRSDGTVAVLVSDPAEDVVAWVDVKSTAANGAVEEVAVLPGDVEDQVYYVVRREVNGTTRRNIEKWALESEGRGGSSNKLADSFVTFNSSDPTFVVTGASHLVGSSVIAWGATADLGSYTVSSTGTFTISRAATTVTYGLPYDAIYKSVKLGYGAQQGSALTQRKRIDHLGLILADYHAQGIEYGPSTATLDPLPLIESGASVSTDAVGTVYDHDGFEFPGEWDTDSRLVLRAVAPRPVTVLGAVISIQTKEK